MNPIPKLDALKVSGLDVKTFDNYYKSAGEFSPLSRKPGTRYLFDKEVIEEWRKNFEWRTVELTLEDYSLCLDFALAQHFRGYVTSDWSTGRQREFGQKITNWVKGQLGEIAVQKFLNKEFDTDVDLDFEIRKKIVPQDIIAVLENRKPRNPRIGVGIKSSKPKNAYLVLSEKEIEIAGRKSDVYIYCRPDIPDDHLLRITKDRVVNLVKKEPHFPLYKEKIPAFSNIPCEVAGWCWVNELKKVTSIPGQTFDGYRYVIQSGQLHRNKTDWEDLLSHL